MEILRSMGVEEAVRRKSEEQYQPDGGINNVESLADRNQGVIYVTNPVLRGFFRLDRSGNRGFLVVNLIGDTARPEIVAAYPEAPWARVADTITEARALELLRAAIGVPEIPVVIEDIATWRATADVADRYQDGRIFLAGDAAHVVPPNGGFGGNTGIHDAHNLAWKLALVLAGTAGPELLATYDAERRPLGELTIEQAYSRYVMRVAPYLGSEDAQALVDDLSMEIGHRCQSAAVVLEPGDHPLHEHPRESRGRPGSRAPHVVLQRAGAEISTLDLFGRSFVLLADPDGRFAEAYGISAAGAVIVRPDGIVAWRAVDVTGVSPDALHDLLASLVCRGDRAAPAALHAAADGGGEATEGVPVSMWVENTDGDAT